MKVKKLTQSDLGAMKRLLPFIGKRWIALLLSLVLAAGSVVLQLYVPILFGDAIDTIVSAGHVDYDAMRGYLRLVLVCAGAAGLCTWGMGLLNNRMTYRIVQDIRYLRRHLEFHEILIGYDHDLLQSTAFDLISDFFDCPLAEIRSLIQDYTICHFSSSSYASLHISNALIFY